MSARAWSRWLAAVVLLLATAAFADDLTEAYWNGESVGRVLGACSVPVFLFIVFMFGGAGVLRSLVASVLPALFGWSIWREEGVSRPARLIAVLFAFLQALGLVIGILAGAVGGLMSAGPKTTYNSGNTGGSTSTLRLGEPVTASEREAIYRAGFLRRCGANTPSSVCACVAAEVAGSRDETDRKRLGFGLQSAGLEQWLSAAKKRCAGLDGGTTLAIVDARPVPPPTPAGPDDALGLNPWCSVSSQPPGASVSLDGQSLGVTPLRTRVRALQKNTLRVELEGFFPVTKVVEPNTHQDTDLALSLRPASRLRVATEPPGASVSVEGKVVLALTPGLSDLLPPGEVDVLIVLAGHEAVQKRVNLVGREEPLSVRLSPGAKVSVTANVPHAEVRLDGVLIGEAPLDLAVPRKGKHTVVVSKPGWSQFTRVLTKVKGNERIAATLVDTEIAGLKKRVASARANYDKASLVLSRLQGKVRDYATPTAAQERQIAAAEKVMENQAAQLEAAESELRIAEARRGP